MKTLKYVSILVVVGLGMYLILQMKPKEVLPPVMDEATKKLSTKPDVMNMEYEIDGDVFVLEDGKGEIAIPDSSTKNILDLFDVTYDDLDQDGDTDAAAWLVNDPGGTGRFFYAVLVINNDGVGKATNTMFLGDRIAPQTIDIEGGRVVYNFAERKADEPMSADPSVGRSIWVHYNKEKNEIGEWVKDFEGEADVSRMTLSMKTWQWISSTYNDGRKIIPKDVSKFSLTFNKDGTFSSSTDCNGIGGNYLVKGNEITFSEMLGTLMYCEGAQENDFKDILMGADSFLFTSRGELVINLKFDSGTVIFK